MKTNKDRVYAMVFADVYPMYIQKAVRKGRSKEEVDEIIRWLMGHSQESLQQQLDSRVTLEAFFRDAPRFNPNAVLIKGMICGYRVEEIEDDILRKMRYLDKLIDELARGRAMEKILRKA